MSLALTNPQTLDDLLLFRLSRLLATAGSHIIRLCEGELGITWREWRLIASLAPQQPMQPSALAARTQLDRARTSRSITSLVAKGLVLRNSVQGDQRLALVHLSAQGMQLYERFFPVVTQLNAQLLQALTAEQCASLDQALTLAQTQAEKLLAQGGQPKANRRAGARTRRPSAGAQSPPVWPEK
ncbi:MarR family winged helix-turn-helix transcriptional regulator [Rhodoferax aquaticus]|uniref:MarR family transcriptional regulator n=1 Tax=Rhodoferax aquaticus TaxID=2527691 RepID=A0A515EPQ2_9BURK|nr:MarR family transcriptional regulator [Rhodoferax aquaticus]QDL54643.1 MarR family transcriptional regulator [Rhodoferax aquaticus]